MAGRSAKKTVSTSLESCSVAPLAKSKTEPKAKAKPIISREDLDHPEHFDDRIREYSTSERYRPTALESQLFELAGHQCTICRAPWLEIHHIEELENGGKTEFSNLIVLCPNCHTRVHKTKVPSKDELRHYKLKQEIAYELPIIGSLSTEEKRLLLETADNVLQRDWIHYRTRSESYPLVLFEEEAISAATQLAGYQYLVETGILDIEVEASDRQVGLFHVVIGVHLTTKGVKWLKYLVETCRIDMFRARRRRKLPQKEV